MLLIHNAIRDFLIFRHVFRLPKTVQNASNIVNLASPSSQSCTLTLTILQPHFDYLAPQDTQDDTPKGWKQHSKPYFPPSETWFSCRGECAWKCQPQSVCDTIFAFLTSIYCQSVWHRGPKTKLHILYHIRVWKSSAKGGKSFRGMILSRKKTEITQDRL